MDEYKKVFVVVNDCMGIPHFCLITSKNEIINFRNLRSIVNFIEPETKNKKVVLYITSSTIDFDDFKNYIYKTDEKKLINLLIIS